MRHQLDGSRFAGELVVVVRRLVRAPAFFVSAVLLLGSGLGVGTAFFNIVNGLLLKSTVGADTFVRLNRASAGQAGWSRLNEDEIARILGDPPASFTSLNGHGSQRTTAVIGGISQPVRVDVVLGRYLDDLGAVPLAGRLLGPADQTPGAEAVAVVSEHAWRIRMERDPRAVGAAISVAGQPVTVVGVMTPSFKGLFANLVATDIWVSYPFLPVRNLFGSLRPDVTFEQANAEVRTRYADRAAADGPGGLHIERGLESLPATAYPVTVGTLAVGAIVAAIAGASLTLLLLARAATNQAEIAVRLALGATVQDIARLLALEVAVVCAAAGLVGLPIASLLANVVSRYFMAATEMGTLALDSSPDWRVFLYMAGTAFAIVFGISVVLARHASRIEALSSMSAVGGAGGATSRGTPARTRLIASQVAAVTTLLFVSALFIRSTVTGLNFEPGFNSRGLAIGWIDQAASHGDATRAWAANRRVLEALRQAPSIERAALATRLPSTLSHMLGTRVRSEARSAASWSSVQSVTADFFEVIGLPVVRGRSFSVAEEAGPPSVAIVSETAAAHFWPGRDPLGQRLWFLESPELRSPVEVIGVVPGVRVESRDRSFSRDIFIPFGYRHPDNAVAIIARGTGPSQAVLDTLRATEQRSQPPLGFLSSHTVEEELAGGLAAAKLIAGISAGLGLVGLFIAVAGLYGITAQLAAHRRKELGIRKALGATNGTLCRMLAAEGTRILLRGIGPGIGAGILAGFALRQRSFPGLDPLDLSALTVVSALLLVTGLVGAVLPFRRVLRDQYAALREL